MKCSEYLWKYLDIHTHMGDISDHEAQGQLNLAMKQNGDTKIVADDSGELMSEREAMSIYGRNSKRLQDAYKSGSKSLFELVVLNQNMSDSEYQDEKKKAEKRAELEKAETGDEGGEA